MVRYYLLALVIIIFDQWTKYLVIKYMELGESIHVLGDFFFITSHRNKGAAWGILQDQMFFFYMITLVVVIGIVYYMEKHAKGQRLFSVALSLILGGALGNFIDRFFRKEVVDFLDVMVFTYDFPIFNVADSALSIGVVLIIFVTFMEEKKAKRNKVS
jgi:signal peptidase II